MPLKGVRRVRRRAVQFGHRRRAAVKWPPKESKLRLALLRKRSRCIDNVNSRIEKMNMRLSQQNQFIEEENERLRKQALLLSNENQILQLKLQEQLQLRLNSSESS